MQPSTRNEFQVEETISERLRGRGSENDDFELTRAVTLSFRNVVRDNPHLFEGERPVVGRVYLEVEEKISFGGPILPEEEEEEEEGGTDVSNSLCVVLAIVVDLLALLVGQARTLQSFYAILIREGSYGCYPVDCEGGEAMVETFEGKKID